MEKLSGLSHLFMTVFLYNFSTFMVIPAITDVTMSALCPGEDECSLAIYLTGIQQAIIGLGTLVMMPLIGNLSDTYGRKAMLTIPMSLTIIPLVILAYSREKYYFYAYYALKTLTAMVCEGSVHCIALAYIASASVAVIATIYMRIFLPDSIGDNGARRNSKEEVIVPLLDEHKDSRNNVRVFKTMPSFDDSISLLRSSLTFSQAAAVAFFSNLGEVGLHAGLMYYLKACFHFNKDQFADLMVIMGIAGTISQMLLMPMLAPVIGEEKLLSIGLFFSCAHMLFYSIAWSSWVPYGAAMFSLLAVFAHPCLRSIASKQVGPSEQGKAQGCISGLCSFGNVLSPLVFSPLTALFLSANAPFHFPGFSIACAGFAVMVAFVQSIMIRAVHPNSSSKVSSYNCEEP
ncbi:Hippocampus abundant transcript 1 protein [Actinidia chinensis var. chinensis]|uniref:Hippocampus abundant transcript 1 protein n=1 Tax=Actinidia chinensis var. chinensis TaxID=1590841 RepID=A0A2R6R031_ACTCC|nr:Hippocampus abundant transcript 1 protein [Actinidia chinensis var. chinensis]